MNGYTTTEMTDLWSDDTTLNLWATIERGIIAAQAEIGQVPPTWIVDTAITVHPTVADWRRATQDRGHEVVAFLELWEELGVEHVHIGVTSSDLTDTALGYRVKNATTYILGDLELVGASIRSLDERYGMSLRLGRTHGQPAVEDTYGHLFNVWEGLIDRARVRLGNAGDDAALCKISGPIGTYMHVDPYVEQTVARELGLQPAQDCTQIVPRDALAAWVAALGTTAMSISAIAMELRLMSHAQINEARDSGGSTSSAMPHKINSNRLERLTGLAQLVTAAYPPIAAGVVQWHERDMAHSSVERTLLPQITGIVHYMARSLHMILDTLEIDQTASENNLLDYRAESQTHSLVTHLQLRGYRYTEAREYVSDLLRRNPTLYMLRVALNNDPMFQFEPDSTYAKEAVRGIL